MLLALGLVASLTALASASGWRLRIGLFPSPPRAESAEERREREQHLAQARRHRRGPLALTVVGGIFWAAGTILAVLAGPAPQVRRVAVDPSNGYRTTTWDYGTPNWIEIGVGVPLLLAGWPMTLARVGELEQANEDIKRFSSPPLFRF